MTDTVIAEIEFDALAFGEDTLVGVWAEANAANGTSVDTASTDTIAIAIGDDLAATTIAALSSVEDGAGSETVSTGSTNGFASGNGSIAVSTVETSATSTSVIDITTGAASSGAAGGTSDAAGEAGGESQALTESTSVSHTGDPDGSGTGVEVFTGGSASGSGSTSVSSAQTFAADTESSDIAIGFGYSIASGDTDAETDALVFLEGDSIASQTTSFDSPFFSADIATGIAVSDYDYSAVIANTTDIDIDIASDVDITGNTAQTTFSVEAFGDDTSATADISVLATEDLSSVSGSIVSAVN